MSSHLVLSHRSLLSSQFWIRSLLVPAIFTSSFDIFLNVNIGFNFRFTQICIIGSMALFVLTKRNLRFVVPVGFPYLLAWCFFIFLFIPNGYLLRNAGYAVWLLFNVLAIILFVQSVRSTENFRWLYALYIYSFVAVGLFGIVQFVMPLLGLEGPLVEQWWVRGLIARSNGFSYEPSYFATYLLIGWVITAYHLYNSPPQYPKPVSYLTLSHGIITLAILLSTSRMGIVMMGLWYVQYPIKFTLSVLRNLRVKKMVLWICGGLLTVALVVAALIAQIDFSIILRLLEGTGLFGTSSHSTTSGRLPTFVEVLEVFGKSPIIGYSLGGVASALAEHRGIAITNLAQLKSHEGVNILAEVLAASGLVGIIPFVTYFVILYRRSRQAIRAHYNTSLGNMVKALLVSLTFELLILQLNQNILRPYLWIHIAMLSTAYQVSKPRRTIASPQSGRVATAA